MRAKQWPFDLINALLVFAVILVLMPGAWAAPKYKVLHAFTGGNDGEGAWSSLIFDKKGNLYSMTTGGGTRCNGECAGTVFELTPGSNGKWTEQILYTFTGGGDGSTAEGTLVFDADGNLYGTTREGGAYRDGTVFELMPSSGGGWTETVLYSFCSDGGYCRDGAGPESGVVIDKAGDLYGTTYYAGPYDGGEIFKVTPGSGGGWSESLLYGFGSHSHDGSGPYAGLIWDAAGNLYGTTEGGGANYAGTVYEIKYSPNGWKERVLYCFGSFKNDGQVPGVGALVFDKSGNLYGTTGGGGTNICYAGCGTVFKLRLMPDGRWKESVLYNFKTGAGGFSPGAGVVVDNALNLYGTTIYGGAYGCGVVFKLAPGSNGKWQYSVLHSFTGGDGWQPDSNLILDKKGNVYGTAPVGGPGGLGVVFEITP